MDLIIRERNTAPTSRKLEVGRTVWTIGRDTGNDIVLNSTQVSRHHAKIVCENGSWQLEDCGSSLGVVLNGKKILKRTDWRPGARAVLGNCVLELSEGTIPEKCESNQKEKEEEAANSTRIVPSTDLVKSCMKEVSDSVMLLYTNEMMALKRRIHERVLAEMHLSDMNVNLVNTEAKADLDRVLNKVLREFLHELPRTVSPNVFKDALLDEIVLYGPISPLLRDDEVDEVMVNGPDMIFVEKKGKLQETGIRFFNERHLISIIQRIVEPLGRHVDEASPMVDARLPDGSRVNAIIPPLALDGAMLTIRKFAKKKLTTDDLIRFGSMTKEMSEFLSEAVRARQNIVISGGTGSGKTTLLNVLSQFIPLDERLVTIEDSAELKLSHRNLARLEARPANIEGKGRIAIRDLVVNSLRMRPDRIIIGECRSGEALDMLQAMNTGHDGSLTTVHANSARDALSRLENMVLMSGVELPISAIREQIASALNLIVQQNRMLDGSRRVTAISEVVGREGNVITMQDIFVYQQEGLSPEGKVLGHFEATGNVPYFVETLRQRGRLNLNINIFSKGARLTK